MSHTSDLNNVPALLEKVQKEKVIGKAEVENTQ